MSLELQIISALLMDFLLGDPRWFPHPVRLIGRVANQVEKWSRRVVPSERTAGICTVFLILAMSGTAGWGLVALAGAFHPLAGDVVSILLLYFCFAARDLARHSRKVADALLEKDLVLARKRVGALVGRDTADLEEEGVVRACVESVAENTVDGVTAPLLWAVLGGPVGALLYKAASTMDSMFGYTNEEYLQFGWASAKLDDLLNWLPARLTGLVMVMSSLLLNMRPEEAWWVFIRDRLNHSSPNSGHAEAAAAGALGIRLGGTSYYFGKPVTKPVIGDDCYPPFAGHIREANLLMAVTTVLTAVLLIGTRMIVTGFFF